jgi:arginyl-tRNA synthetase
VLVNASVKDGATLKVVWTAQCYQVELKAVARVPRGVTLSSHNNNSKTALVIDNTQVVQGGGNAMALVLTQLSASRNSNNNMTQAMVCDEWCEWERTVLKPALLPKTNPKKLASALLHLETTLSQPSAGLHLLGTTHATLADIVVVSTLTTANANATNAIDTSAYPSLTRYVNTHQAAITNAQEAVTKLVASTSYQVDYAQVSLYKVLADIFQRAIEDLIADCGVSNVDLAWTPNMVSRCNNPKHGDYQCSAAMPVFAALKKAAQTAGAAGTAQPLPAHLKSPVDVAQTLMALVGDKHPVVMELVINGPGFIACRVQASFLQHHINTFLDTGKLPMPKVEHKTCLVDFSSPNIAKEMHVGHLRSTIIGESVCRVLEHVGHTVHRVNHVGDWGTQFGMLIQYLREEFPAVEHAPDGELPNITDLTVFYKSAKQRFDDSAEFKKASQLNVVQLQAGDVGCHKIWKMLCDVSRREFAKVYKRLDVTVEEVGESFYNALIPPVIDELDAKGMLKKEEAGAKLVFVDKFAAPLMLQKTDGGFGYDSTDMAALKYRLQVLKADRIIIITDFSQGDHFKMIYSAGRSAGWLDRDQKLEHIGFGTVQGEDGKRFKTRSGDTVRLVDLLDEAVNRMRTSLEERMKEGKATSSKEDLEETAAALGYSAVRYYDLKRNPTTNYKFSYDEMLDTKGDTAVYLLFATVRLESIAAKAKVEYKIDVEELLKNGERVTLEHPSERNLALHLLYFTDTILTTLDDLYPYHLCEFVYKLSIAATEFVTKCRVMGSPEMKSRLLLCHATTSAMRQAFDLLGLRHVKRI